MHDTAQSLIVAKPKLELVVVIATAIRIVQHKRD